MNYQYNDNDYYQFITTMLLIYEMYNHKNMVIEDSILNVNKKMDKFFKGRKFDNKKLKEIINNYSKFCINESYNTSIVLLFYSEFEKYIKELCNVEKTGRKHLREFLKSKLNYDYDENTYSDEVEKFRMINNSIKHGTPTEELKKRCPEIILVNKIGKTTYKYSYNISDQEIIDCFNCLINFVNELNDFVQDCL